MEADIVIVLRADQERYVADLRTAFRSHRTVLGCAPTGYGKTVVSAHIAQQAAAKGSRVMFTCHRSELMTQTAKTFDDFAIPYGLVQAGMIYDSTPLVHIASIDTLRNRLDQIAPPDLLVVDECHLAMADGWRRIIERCAAMGARVLGNSGSPLRLDGKSLGHLFSGLVVAPSTAELIAAGHLSQFRYFAPSSPDMTGVRKKLGDYDRKEVEARSNTSALVGDIVRHWQTHALGRRTVCFTVSHAHSDHLVAAFGEAGIRAASITAKSPPAERRRTINAFADGEVSVLCNVELVTTGFDLAAQVGRDVTVEAIIMARPTQSLALCLQMWGRALRRKSDPAIILDHAGNSERHGWPDDPREWTLDGESKPKAAKSTVRPPATCLSCFGQCRHPIPAECPHCGAPFPVDGLQRSFDADESAELVEITDEARERDRRDKRREEASCATLEDWQTLASARGYKPGWAVHRFEARIARR